MDRRETCEAVTGNIVAAAASAGVSLATLAQATDIEPFEMDGERAIAPAGYTIPQLARVGGFLRVPLDSLMKGAAA